MNPTVAELIRELYSFRAVWQKRRHVEIVDALVAHGSDAVLPLLDALRTRPLNGGPPSQILYGAAQGVVRALGRIGDPRALDGLVYALWTGSNSLNPLAAEALGLLGDRQAIPSLVGVLRNPRFVLTYHAAARSLAQLADERDVRDLCYALRMVNARYEPEKSDGAEERAVREEVVARLGALGDPQAVAPLLARVDAAGVVDALVRIGAPGAGGLIFALDPVTGLDSEAALLALIRIGRDAAPALRGALQGQPAVVSSRCAMALCLVDGGDESLIPHLVPALDEVWSPAVAVQALSRLEEHSTSPALRSALPGLARLSHEQGLPDGTSAASRELARKIDKKTAGLRNLPVASVSPAAFGADLPRSAEAPVHDPCQW